MWVGVGGTAPAPSHCAFAHSCLELFFGNVLEIIWNFFWESVFRKFFGRFLDIFGNFLEIFPGVF